MGDDKKIQNDFLEAYEKHSDALFRHCYFRVDSRDVALDLVQDTFLKTWEYVTKNNDIKNIKAFLFKVLSNVIIDYYRKNKTESLDSKIDDGIQFASAEKENNIVLSSETNMVVRAIEKLPDTYKNVVFMRYVDDLSPKEIADILGENENAVSVRIHRGVEKLKEILHI